MDVVGSQALGAELHKWHEGQGDATYQLGSLWYAGRAAPRELVERSVSNLERQQREALSNADRQPRERARFEREAKALGALIRKVEAAMAGGRSGPRLPDLFERLTARDWAHVRTVAEGQSPGDEESVATSVGYIDVGRHEKGLRYVGGMSTLDGRALEYRRVMQPAWR